MSRKLLNLGQARGQARMRRGWTCSGRVFLLAVTTLSSHVCWSAVVEGTKSARLMYVFWQPLQTRGMTRLRPHPYDTRYVRASLPGLVAVLVGCHRLCLNPPPSSRSRAHTHANTHPILCTSNTQDEGFDFDAHVARLMEASAKETGLRQRTADDDLQTRGLSRLRRDSDDDDDSDDDSVGDGGGSDESGEIDDALLEGLDLNGGGGGSVLEDGTEERAVLDSQFEAVSRRCCCRVSPAKESSHMGGCVFSRVFWAASRLLHSSM